ncbi:MAG: exonuclease SbcCD subunit D [Eubacteriales bacterium]|nr:exonuclease SbcCD subunit D [Eubacteriales bacterium]
MRFLHLADLHLGIRLNGYDRLPEQAVFLDFVLETVAARDVDAVVISGDIYDKATPSMDAVALFERFFNRLKARGTVLLAVTGNHDSRRRLAYCGRILSEHGIYITACVQCPIPYVTLTDAYGPVRFYMQPFVRGSDIAPWRNEAATTAEAFSFFLSETPLDEGERNVLLAHQFFAGAASNPLRSDSERITVGGTDRVDAGPLAVFDYAALGHLHGAQTAGADHVRYAGSPLMYSLSEERQKKSMPLVTLGPKGTVEIETIPIPQTRSVRKITGSFAAIMADEPPSDDYVAVVLTDTETVTLPAERLRTKFPNFLSITYLRTARQQSDAVVPEAGERPDPMAIFSSLFEQSVGVAMSAAQRTVMEDVLAVTTSEEETA